MILLLLLAAAPASQPVGLTLEDCMRKARAASPLINDAELQTRVTMAQRDQAFWAFWTPIEVLGILGGPTPEAHGNGRYVRTEASAQGDLNFGAPGFFLGYSVRGAVPLVTFGKLSSLRAAANHGVDIARSNKQRVENETMANVTRGYFAHQVAMSFLELVDDAEKQLNEALKNGEQMVKQGSDQVSDSDLFMLRSLLGNLLARRAEARQGLESSRELMRFLTQSPADDPLVMEAAPMAVSAHNPPSAAAFEDLARDRRAELRMAQKAIDARKEALWIRKAMFLPDFLLLGYFTQNFTSNQDYQRNPFLNNSTNALEGGVAIGARFTLDIPTKLAQMREAEAELARAQNTNVLAESGILLQVRKAYQEATGAREQALQYVKAEKAARSWVVSSLLNFNSGLSPAGDLFQAIRASAETGGQRRKAELDFALGLAALGEATGAGYAEARSVFTGESKR